MGAEDAAAEMQVEEVAQASGGAVAPEAEGAEGSTDAFAAGGKDDAVLGATAELYENMSLVHLLLEPPRMRCGPAGVRQTWDELPCCAAEARAGIGAVAQLLAIRGCQSVVLASRPAAADEPSVPQCECGRPFKLGAVRPPSKRGAAALSCDECQAVLAAGTAVWSCAFCDHDICAACKPVDAPPSPPPPPESDDAQAAEAESATQRVHPARSLLRLPEDARLAVANASRSLARGGPLLPRVVELAHHCGSGEAQLRSAQLDYLGTLRTICRLETGRAEEKRQRRFINYLDRFGPRSDEWKLLNPMMSN